MIHISIHVREILFISLLMDIGLFILNKKLLKYLQVNSFTYYRISDAGVRIKSFINFFSTVLATTSNIFSFNIYRYIRNLIIEPLLGYYVFEEICAFVIVFDLFYILHIILDIVWYKRDEGKLTILEHHLILNRYINLDLIKKIYNVKLFHGDFIVHRLLNEGFLRKDTNRKHYYIINI